MAKAYSSAYKSTLAAVSAPEAPLILLVINHVDLTTPIRVVNDTQNITSNGNSESSCGLTRYYIICDCDSR
jgi:hypothetical protein